MTHGQASERQVAAGAAAVAVLLLLGGCAASPPAPVERYAVAEAAISDAVGAGAAELAPVPLRSAQDKLMQANGAMAAHRYGDARRLAEEAEVDARLAAVTARSRKAQRAVAEVESGIRALREEIARNSAY